MAYRRGLDDELSRITADERSARAEADRETLAYAKLEDQISNAKVEDQMFSARLAQIGEALSTAKEAVSERTARRLTVEGELAVARARSEELVAAIATGQKVLADARAGESAARGKLSSAQATLSALRSVDADVEKASPLVAAMRELAKVVNVTRKRCQTMPVSVVLVIDATTGQNGLNQAKEFNQALDLDGLIVTKLDGTAKGGIALAISHQLDLPIFRIGVGETIDDLQSFDALDFCRALVGEGM